MQITNGPASDEDYGRGGATDLLIGYSADEDVLVAYDVRWLKKWTRDGGSPSIQVRSADIQAAKIAGNNGIHRLTKSAAFDVAANIATIDPEAFPAFLENHSALLTGAAAPSPRRQMFDPAAGLAAYCRESGFTFDEDLLARYLASIAAKPLVILAGVSGTGKSKLATLVAEYYSLHSTSPNAPSAPTPATPTASTAFVFAEGAIAPDPLRFALVPVRPDWTDNQSILGFVNPITASYEPTAALELTLRALQAWQAADPQAAAPRYFMLLDEMNLARVEHYFSDWLACIESRRTRATSLVAEPVPLHRAEPAPAITLPGVTGAIPVPQSLQLPPNLVITGTVNVDESTHGFSPKVLDRGMVIEFDNVDLDGLRASAGAGAQGAGGGYRLWTELPAFRLASKADYLALPEWVHLHLKQINQILERAQLHFGYRSACEMALFMALYRGMLPEGMPNQEGWLKALDVAILQKILPKVGGSQSRLGAPLADLCFYLRDLVASPPDATSADLLGDDQASLPKSYGRAHVMLRALEGFGFVTFFK